MVSIELSWDWRPWKQGTWVGTRLLEIPLCAKDFKRHGNLESLHGSPHIRLCIPNCMDSLDGISSKQVWYLGEVWRWVIGWSGQQSFQGWLLFRWCFLCRLKSQERLKVSCVQGFPFAVLIFSSFVCSWLFKKHSRTSAHLVELLWVCAFWLASRHPSFRLAPCRCCFLCSLKSQASRSFERIPL